MKAIRVFLTLITVVAVLFASTLSANAIGFEAEQVYESVFVIYSGNSLGSGFAIGENCIVTNAHVIGNRRSITVSTYAGTEYPAAVLGMDEQMDIAVLCVDQVVFPYLEIADLAAMKTGDDIYAIGAPKGMAYTLTKGGISAKERVIGEQSYIQIDAAINEGNSGGPLLNDAGHVLGMNTLKMSDSEGIGMAIPITRVCDYVKTLGIVLDEKGNVSGRVVPQEETMPSQTNPTVPEKPSDNDEKEDREKAPSTVLLYAVSAIAAVSLLVNVVLTVLLINKKKKKPTVVYDPSERTDFEIEILE